MSTCSNIVTNETWRGQYNFSRIAIPFWLFNFPNALWSIQGVYSKHIFCKLFTLGSIKTRFQIGLTNFLHSFFFFVVAISYASSHFKSYSWNRFFVMDIHVVFCCPLGRIVGLRAWCDSNFAGALYGSRVIWPNQFSYRILWL